MKFFNFQSSVSKGNPQSGVTLLLAVFIVSGLVLIALSVSYLAIQGVRNSRASSLSEIAIGSAHSGAEEGVWAVKRLVSVPNCDNPVTTSEQLGNRNAWSARSYCKNQGMATLTLVANTPLTFYLYDPEDPNGDLDLFGMANEGYHNMTVTSVTGTHNTNVTITRLNGNAVGDPPSPVTVAPGNSRFITQLKGQASQDNRMMVTLLYWPGGPTGSETATVTVDTDAGMPTMSTVNALGCSGISGNANCTNSGTESYTRQLNVTLPGSGISASPSGQ